MRLLRLALVALLLFSGFKANQMEAKTRIEPEMYVFGFSASFTDSIVYFTDIQKLDSAWYDTKTKFLLGRDNYSYQFRDYLKNSQNMPYRTCIVMFATSKKKADKKFQKLKKVYTVKSTGYDVRYLTSADFAFQAVDMSVLVEDEEQMKAEKKKKKTEKKKKKAEMKNMPGKGTPPGDGQPPMGEGGGRPPMM